VEWERLVEDPVQEDPVREDFNSHLRMNFSPPQLLQETPGPSLWSPEAAAVVAYAKTQA